MRKTVKIIFLIIFMWIVLAITSKTNAASANITASKTTATVGDTVTVTVSINAAAWNLSVSGSATDSIVGANLDAVNQKTTKTYKVKSDKVGTCTVSLTGDVSDGTTDVTSQINTSVKINFKEKSTNGDSNTSGGNSGSTKPSDNTTKPKTPTFTNTNKIVYAKNDCNLRSSWSTSSSATPVKEGTELKLTGTSSQTINGYVWYRVTYNGSTKYIASSLITETKPKKDDEKDEKNEKSSNKSLSSLSIEGVEISPSFDKDTTQYTANVGGDVTELKINAKAENSKAKVTVEGNKNLTEGDNVIKIKVTAEDETTRTYFITVTVGEGTVTDNGLKLSELKIERVNFEGNFNPDTYNYQLSLSSYVDKLDITATPSKADATVEIIGNQDFKEGKNTVTILLTSADGKETATYQIEVEVPAGLEIEKNKESSMVLYIVIGIVIAAAIIAIFVFVRSKVRKNKNGLEYDETNFDKEKNNNDYEEQDKPKKPRGRHSV